MVRQTDWMSVIYEILSGFASVNLIAGNYGPQQLQQDSSNALFEKSMKHIQHTQMKTHAWIEPYIGYKVFCDYDT